MIAMTWAVQNLYEAQFALNYTGNKTLHILVYVSVCHQLLLNFPFLPIEQICSHSQTWKKSKNSM